VRGVEQARLIESRTWWHSIELDGGVVTPGKVPLYYLKRVLGHLKFPESFAGLSVLDIGAWDGFFSFEAERRGAARVVAYDLHPPDHYGFETAKRLLGSKVEYVQGSVYDVSPEVLGTFDVVFFLGVLYHLRYPLLALDRIWEMTRGYALIETHHLDNCVLMPEGTSCGLAAIDPRLAEVALYQFYRHDELTPDDFSNWFAPNRRAIEDGLWSAGFEPELLAAWGDRIAFKAQKVAGVPEYRRATYEGLKWQVRADGSQAPEMEPREAEAAARPLERDRTEWKHLRAQVIALRGALAGVEVDRAARLELLYSQARRLGQLESERNLLDAEASVLRRELAAAEADRAARLRVIESQGRRLGEVEAERNLLRAQVAQQQGLQRFSQVVQSARVYRLLRRLGRWKFIEELASESPGPSPVHRASEPSDLVPREAKVTSPEPRKRIDSRWWWRSTASRSRPR
jgi:tRNA (mo5U34)-methyltransferase